MVDRDHRRHAELAHVLDMAAEIGAALLHGLDVLLAEVLLLDAAVIFMARMVATMTAAAASGRPCGT